MGLPDDLSSGDHPRATLETLKIVVMNFADRQCVVLEPLQRRIHTFCGFCELCVECRIRAFQMIRFVKAHAYGNDFLYVRADAVDGVRLDAFARELCDRHTGIGADGLIVYEPRPDGASMRLFNADGGRAEVSGNGVRALGAILLNGTSRTLRSAAKSPSTPKPDQRCSRWSAWTGPVRCSAPRWAPRTTSVSSVSVDGEALSPNRDGLRATRRRSCSAPCPSGRFHRIGARTSAASALSAGTNLEFATVEALEAVRILIWERGVGPTTSSGTGSCAALRRRGGLWRRQPNRRCRGARRSPAVEWQRRQRLPHGLGRGAVSGEWLGRFLVPRSCRPFQFLPAFSPLSSACTRTAAAARASCTASPYNDERAVAERPSAREARAARPRRARRQRAGGAGARQRRPRGADALAVANELLAARGGLHGLVQIDGCDELARVAGVGRGPGRAAGGGGRTGPPHADARAARARCSCGRPSDAAAFLMPRVRRPAASSSSASCCSTRSTGCIRTTVLAVGTLNSAGRRAARRVSRGGGRRRRRGRRVPQSSVRRSRSQP